MWKIVNFFLINFLLINSMCAEQKDLVRLFKQTEGSFCWIASGLYCASRIDYLRDCIKKAVKLSDKKLSSDEKKARSFLEKINQQFDSLEKPFLLPNENAYVSFGDLYDFIFKHDDMATFIKQICNDKIDVAQAKQAKILQDAQAAGEDLNASNYSSDYGKNYMFLMAETQVLATIITDFEREKSACALRNLNRGGEVNIEGGMAISSTVLVPVMLSKLTPHIDFREESIKYYEYDYLANINNFKIEMVFNNNPQCDVLMIGSSGFGFKPEDFQDSYQSNQLVAAGVLIEPLKHYNAVIRNRSGWSLIDGFLFDKINNSQKKEFNEACKEFTQEFTKQGQTISPHFLLYQKNDNPLADKLTDLKNRLEQLKKKLCDVKERLTSLKEKLVVNSH